MELIAHLMGSHLARQQISIAMRMFDPFPAIGRIGRMGHMDLRLRLENIRRGGTPGKLGTGDYIVAGKQEAGVAS
jgi:hypothetical protein